MKNIINIIFLIISINAFGQESRELAIGQPNAIVDLRTNEGAKLVKATWKYSDAKLVDAKFNAPGPDKNDPLLLYPTGKTIHTQDLMPKAGAANFDDSKWITLDPTKLEERRGTGLASFVWYRMNVTIPNKVGDFDPTGSTVVFEIVVDDYSEIWVNGKLNKTFGQSGEGVAKGFNARNRVVLTQNAQPGQQFQIAILGTNGPIADLPTNYIWIRSATLDFYKTAPKRADWQNLGQIVKIDKELDNVLDANVKIEKLADGFQFTEGPVWHPDGFLLFSDPNTNVIYKYDPISGNISIYITKSGYTGFNIGEYHQPGSNGLAIDSEGRLVVCQHGNRRVIRHEKKGPITVLSDNYNGKRLNSPNDVVIKSDGTIYFTDPPYGLPKAYNDTKKELNSQGVYRIKNGKTELLTTDLGGPNGIAFSPDEQYLYVSNWDIRDIHHTKTLWRFPVQSDGTLGKGEIFFDMNQTDDDEALDGVKVDNQGFIFSSAPGGVWIISPQGKYLGKIIGPERPANMAWGDDGKTLYLTAHTGLYKIRTKNGGKVVSHK
ncbi:MAG: SMP-30/gluconolactonase/LRE family protein [Saprospiraceae bacterium]|nr:SMP-30/gluconolactonase/LRE family protein [Saprospiraceae bacterium]